MKLTTRRPAAQTAAIAPADARWGEMIRTQYGDLRQLSAMFAPGRQAYCAENHRRAIAAGVPSVVRVMRTYGRDGFRALLKQHIADALIWSGDYNEGKLDEIDLEAMAESVLAMEAVKMLTMAGLLKFFHGFKTGDVEVFGRLTPRKFAEALKKYASATVAEEGKMRREIEAEEQKREAEAHDARSVTFEQWAASRGIDPGEGGVEAYIARQSHRAQTPAV